MSTTVYTDLCSQIAALTDVMSAQSGFGVYSAAALADTAPTVSAAQMVAGIVTGVPTAARAYTMPAASAVLALIPKAAAGSSFWFVVKNQSTTGFDITVTASGTITNGGVASDFIVKGGTNAIYLCRFSAVDTAAIVMYRVDTKTLLNFTGGQVSQYKAAAAINTTAPATAAQVYGGIITSTTAAAVTITMPAASALLALVPGAIVGSTVEVTIKNLGGSNAITVADSGTITNAGSTADLTIAHDTNGSYIVIFTNVGSGTEAATYYRK